MSTSIGTMVPTALYTAGRVLVRWPFTSLGLVTAAMFTAHEFYQALPAELLPALRVLIVPLWLMRTVEVAVGLGALPQPFQIVVALPLLFLPYIGADLVLGWARRRLSPRSPS